jgi:hypothetical protein
VAVRRALDHSFDPSQVSATSSEALDEARRSAQWVCAPARKTVSRRENAADPKTGGELKLSRDA